MPTADDIRWFKERFQKNLTIAIRKTPFTVDMLTAIACQETGEIWAQLRRRSLGVDRILELCVGDTIDGHGSKGRRAFPRTRAELEAKPDGARMFAIAHRALVDMAQYVPGYEALAAKPDKFCHGFGIFQYDLQHFLTDQGYFLERRYRRFDHCVRKCLAALRDALEATGWEGKTVLGDLEMAGVAIAYNTGRYAPSKGLKQGHFDGRKYYGESFFDFLRLARTAAVDGHTPAWSALGAPGRATVAPPTPVAASGPCYEVATFDTALRLRSEPRIDRRNANVLTRLPDGHVVRAVSGARVEGFLEVETSLLGAHYRGFVAAKYLKPSGATAVPMATPAPAPPSAGIVAVSMPRAIGSVTKRTQPAGAHSLNEPNQPGRKGRTPDELRGELAAIVDWLAVDRTTHRRYQPRDRATFCNVYAHDYCHLAGVYLPRVWWTQPAIEALTRGETVEPRYGTTIDEQRANDLFRWLRDCGLRFGWRRTSTLTKLQLEVDQGAVGLIVARRTNDGLSGHVVVVVPETHEERARRDGNGAVVAPLQSQAGTKNFRYGRGTASWWTGVQFAESAFWLHA